MRNLPGQRGERAEFHKIFFGMALVVSRFPILRGSWAAAVAALLGALWSPQASAAGLTLEVNARRTDGGALSDLQGGARLEVEALLANPGPRAVRLESARLSGEGPVRMLSATAPGLSAEGGTLDWTSRPETLAPGESRRLLFAVEADRDAPAGADVSLNFAAQGAELEPADESAPPAPLRAETAVALSLAPVKLMLERALPPESSNPLAHGDALRVILGAEFPAGRARGVTLTLEIPPSAETTAPLAPALTTSAGADLRCSGGEAPAFDGPRLVWRLGDCSLPPGASAAGRRVEVSARFRLRDADPFLSAEEIAAYRAQGFRATLEAQGGPMGEATISAQMGGPLIAGILSDPPERRVFEAGDQIAARYEIRNLGDAPAQGFELWTRPDEALDCGAVRLILDPPGRAGSGPCGVSAIPQGGALEPGESLTALLEVQAREEAPLGSALRVGLDAAAEGVAGKAPRMRVHMLEMAPREPDPPRLTLADDGDWIEAGLESLARPGDGAELEVAFRAPKGAGRTTILLLARLLEAETAFDEPTPVGPGPLLLGTPQVEAGAAWMEAPLAERSPPPTDEEGWRVLRIPLGLLRTPVAEEDPVFRLRAPVRIDPAAPEARAGRSLEIRAALLSGGPEAYGESRSRIDSEEGLLVELQEPDLALTVSTADSDRMIRAGETAEFAGDLCNLGEASARGVALEAALGPGWDAAGPQGVLLRRSDSDWPILDDAPVLRAQTPYDPQSRTLRLSPGQDWEGELGAAECLRLSLRLTAAPTEKAEDRVLAFRLSPYESGAEPRRYEPPPAVRAVLREARLALEAGGEVLVRRGGALKLEGALTAPPTGGPYEVSWRLRSAAGLRWRAYGEPGEREVLPNVFTLAAGETRRFRLESAAPSETPAGWTETLAMHASAQAASGEAYPAAARWVARLERDAEAAAALSPTKTMAIDRDCDGDLADEAPQDALFERFKDLRAGECLIFRIHLRNDGASPLEDVTLTETPQPGLRFLQGSATIGPTAEGFLLESVREPTAQSPLIFWRFQGILPPGAEAEARYGAKAPDTR